MTDEAERNGEPVSAARARALEPVPVSSRDSEETVRLEIELDEVLFHKVRAICGKENGYISNVEQAIAMGLRSMLGLAGGGFPGSLLFLAELMAFQRNITFGQALFGEKPEAVDRRRLHALLTGQDPGDFEHKYEAEAVGGRNKEAWARKVAKQLAADLNEDDALDAARELGHPNDEVTEQLMHWVRVEFAER